MTIKVRDYEVRLARTKEERKQVRQLRYLTFVEEEGASATEEQKQLREEYDSFDRFADYMVVVHNKKVVGTYRIIGREAAEKMGGFYTEEEYDLDKIKRIKGNIIEMSRACVDPEYRDEALVMRMLWAGLADFIVRNKVLVVFGTASYSNVGLNPSVAAQAMSYLYYNHLQPLNLRAVVKKENFVEGVNQKWSQMNILPKAFVDEKIAKSQMTPLTKGYLALGAKFGKGIFIDKPFGSFDVFVCIQSKDISKIYQKHFLGSENALENFHIEDGAMKKLGKAILLPVTGPFKIIKAFTQFILRDDAEDIEYIDDNKEGENNE